MSNVKWKYTVHFEAYPGIFFYTVHIQIIAMNFESYLGIIFYPPKVDITRCILNYSRVDELGLKCNDKKKAQQQGLLLYFFLSDDKMTHV